MTDAKNPHNRNDDVPEQLRIRREKRARLLEDGIDAYPVVVDRTTSITDLRNNYVVLREGEGVDKREGVRYLAVGEETQDEVAVAGRVIFVRNTGKLCFATLQEGNGTKLQAMLSLAEVGEESLANWKTTVDLGDIVSVRGRVISSKRGELSVLANTWHMASKALRPLPKTWTNEAGEAVTLSEEQRVRRRELDLLTRPAARDMVRTRAAEAPVDADLTGGLGDDIDLVALRENAAAQAAAPTEETEAPAVIKALPTPVMPTQPTAPQWGEVSADLDDLVVIISTGEVSTWGSGRTRREAELGMSGGEDVDLTAAGVLELAWGMGLLTWQDSPKAGWYDTDGEMVEESDILERYRDEVVARCGIREFVDDGVIAPIADEEVTVYLDRDITLSVPDEATARTIEASDPEHTLVVPDAETGEWTVTRLAGSLARVPRRAVLSRTIVQDRFQGAEAQRVMALIMMVFSIAPSFAPVIGGWLQATFGWHSVFIMLTGYGLVLWLIWQLGIPETLPKAQRTPLQLGRIVGNYGKVLFHRVFILRVLSIALVFIGVAIT